MIKIEKKDFTFLTDKESLEYFVKIVELMMTRFGIRREEAIWRINKSFSHVEAVVGEDDYIYREFPLYWANHFYYGKESFWWVDQEERERMNLPPLKPINYGEMD